jgi:hypothetical protein
MNITLRHFERTSLNEQAFLKLVKKYAHNLMHDVVISFDNRISTYYGEHSYDSDKKIHFIKISPKKCTKFEKKIIDAHGQKYNFLSTVIHELKHASQQDQLGREFWSRQYSCAKGVKNLAAAEFYSEKEIEARIFENENVVAAVEYYDSCCKK